MSTAYRPDKDGQTERTNQTIEAYLRPFINQEQDDWVDLLPMAEYAYNNSMTTATGMSPFYANYAYHPETTTPTIDTPILHPGSNVYAHCMINKIESARQNLEKTRERMNTYYDPKHKPAPQYNPGDPVML